MSEKRTRRSFTQEFKQDAVDLVVNQGYSFKAAAEAVGIGVQTQTHAVYFFSNAFRFGIWGCRFPPPAD